MGHAMVLDADASVITGFAAEAGGGVFLATHMVFCLTLFYLAPSV